MTGTKLNLAGIVDESIVDGPGLRLTVFTQGCPHHCPGCHNPQTWDFRENMNVDVGEILARYDEDPLLEGVTFSGGEPMAQAGALSVLARAIRERGGDVWCYTGYTYEELVASSDPDIDALLEEVDVLVDGPFVMAMRDPDIDFRGSSNQRLLDRDERRMIREHIEAQNQSSPGMSPF